MRRLLRRVALAATVAALVAAGLTVALTLGSGPASGQELHGSMGTSTQEQPTTSAPAPPDPLAAPASAPADALPPNVKAAALANVHAWVPAVAALCGVSIDFYGGYGIILCSKIMAVVVVAYEIYQDPPDPNFAQIGLPSPQPASPVSVTCPKRLSHHDCAGLKAATQAWANAISDTVFVAGAAMVAANRFSGAVQAGSVSGAVLQAAAEKALSGELVTALTAEQKAGGVLGFMVRRLKLDLRPTAKAYAAMVKKATSAPPKAAISAVLGYGLGVSAADLTKILQAAAQGAPARPLSSAIGAGFQTTALNALYQSISAKEYAALVRGLVAQKAVSSTAGNAFLDDLRQAALASSPTARTPFLVHLGTDVSNQATGPAQTLLTVAISGLVFS